MSIEQSTTTSNPYTPPASAIENEIPTYRAISPQAVASVILGVLAVLSFAHWIFLVCAAGAIVLGILADRKIVRQNDVLTGRGIAQAGIALGLIFGLSALTTTAVQNWLLVNQATKFAKIYEGVLNKGSFDDAIWYGQPPMYRSGKTPLEVVTEMKKSRPGGSMFDMEHMPLMRLRERLNEGGADIRLSEIEQYGKEGLNAFAAVRYELYAAGSTPLPEEERFAVVLLKGLPRGQRFDWWVEKVGFPYKPKSFQPITKPVDDGHGHGGH